MFCISAIWETPIEWNTYCLPSTEDFKACKSLLVLYKIVMEFKRIVKWQLKETYNRRTRVGTKNIKKNGEGEGEGGSDGGRKAAWMEGGSMGKGWKVKIECEIWKRGIHDHTEGCKGWRGKCREVFLPGKLANTCTFGWELEGCSLSDINTEYLEVCYWGEGTGSRMETLNTAGSKGVVR